MDENSPNLEKDIHLENPKAQQTLNRMGEGSRRWKSKTWCSASPTHTSKKKNPHVEQFKQSIHRILAKYLQTSKKGKKSFT